MATSYSDRQIAEMNSDLESDLVERKRSFTGDRIRRNICAFANDLPGHDRPGVILVGVDDDGGCADRTVGDRLLRDLAGVRDDGNIVPLPSLVVQKRSIDGCDVAVVMVAPSRHPPVRYKGRVWVRVGPTVRLATAEEEQRLAERRRAGDLPFDSRPVPGTGIGDLDLEHIRRQYLPRAVTEEVLDRNRRSLRTQLRSLRLLSGDVPTWGALLGLSKDPLRWIPGAYVQMLRIDGLSITDPIVAEQRLAGILEHVLTRLEGLLRLNVRKGVDIVTGPREINHVDYPLAALRQLALNAVMHRTYEGSNAPVRLYWYRDRIEIMSPGGLYGQVTEENLGEGATDYRNPLLAEIMHHLGFAQRFGLGIPLARDELARNGNPPADFSVTPTQVTVTVRPAA